MAAILEQEGLLDRLDLIRLDVGRRLDPARRVAMGQFFTPAPAARFMADMSEATGGEVRLLDPGLGSAVCRRLGLPGLIWSRGHRPFT